MAKNSFEIISNGDITIQNFPILDLKFDHEKLDEIWKEICNQKNNKLFNGKVLTYIDSIKQNDTLIVKAGFVDYKIVISSRSDPSLGLKIKQIGVSGITIICDDDNEYVLFSTRSFETTEYPNFLELVPSGNIDESTLQHDGTVDFSTKLLDEFVEETGLDKQSIQKIVPLCLVLDKKNQVYDVCCKINIISSKSNIFKTFKKVSEYGTPELVHVNSLEKFIEQNYSKIVPTSLAILTNLTKNNHYL